MVLALSITISTILLFEDIFLLKIKPIPSMICVLVNRRNDFQHKQGINKRTNYLDIIKTSLHQLFLSWKH